MATETSPAFQFYVKEWRSSRAVMRMTFAQRGMFLEMLLEQWEHFSLPDCPEAVAQIIGGTEDEWREAWSVLRRKFADRRSQPRDDASDPDQKRIVNLKLEDVRKKLRRYKVTARKGGLTRGKFAKRGNNGTYLPAREPAGAPADIQQETSTPSPSPSPSPTPTPSASTQIAVRDPFDDFWAVYPKKTGKDAARNAWKKRRIGGDLAATLIAALAWQKQQDSWLKDGGQFVPNPATWINQGRWQDEPVEAPTPRSRMGKQSERLLLAVANLSDVRA